MPAIVVHGGAGLQRKADTRPYEEGCARAAGLGYEILARGGPALDAVVAAVQALEDNPIFNAGTGSVLNQDGEVENDAALMEGANLRAGAVAAVKGIRNPILLARRVMEESGHLLLVGPGALRFAREVGMEEIDPREMITAEARVRWREERLRHPPPGMRRGFGTVGACALDARGDLAAATSTGGTTYKRAGRVGDTPLIGAGTYADNLSGAVSCTGHGEDIMRMVLARMCCARMAGGMSAQEAAEASIREMGERIQGEGGLICLDRQGRVGVAYNSQAMSRAFIAGGAAVVSAA